MTFPALNDIMNLTHANDATGGRHQIGIPGRLRIGMHGRLHRNPQLIPAEKIEQSYDLAMIALADYLSREHDAAATVDRLMRILDRDSLREAITEVLVDARVHPRSKSGPGATMTVWIYNQGEELKVFATEEIAQAWLDENDLGGRGLRVRGDRRANSIEAADRGALTQDHPPKTVRRNRTCRCADCRQSEDSGFCATAEA
ncbi:hypothetical protein [Bradyrhizobium sp. RDM4]|uniref:hypothetical protein n=1 Tax=Bradyrhizobium sp. RDM4 TaxID=3378765 RepID=UPI0038FC8E9A